MKKLENGMKLRLSKQKYNKLKVHLMSTSSRYPHPSLSVLPSAKAHQSLQVDKSWPWVFWSPRRASGQQTQLPANQRLSNTEEPGDARFSLLRVVLSIVLLIVLRTSPIASFTRISSLYSCFNKLCAVPLFAPIHVAFQPE